MRKNSPAAGDSVVRWSATFPVALEPRALGADTFMAAPIANPTDLDEVIEHARSEVRVLLQQRVEIRKRLTVLRRTIIDLGRIFGHDPTSLRPLTLLRPPRR